MKSNDLDIETLVLEDETIISQHQKIRNNPEQYTPAPDLP